MFRKAFCFALMALMLSHVSLWADTPRPPLAPQASGGSSTKRVVWTLVGIGAGFGAGLLIGLQAFDDAIDSDRKVWTSAVVGAAVGGLAGGLLSKNVGRVPTVATTGSRSPRAVAQSPPWTPALSVLSEKDDDLRERVRRVGAAGIRD